MSAQGIPLHILSYFEPRPILRQFNMTREIQSHLPRDNSKYHIDGISSFISPNVKMEDDVEDNNGNLEENTNVENLEESTVPLASVSEDSENKGEDLPKKERHKTDQGTFKLDSSKSKIQHLKSKIDQHFNEVFKNRIEYTNQIRGEVSSGEKSGESVKTKNPFKTLFIRGLKYSTSERQIKKCIEEKFKVSKIRKVLIVYDKFGNSRGYAFVEFERERDMQAVLKSFLDEEKRKQSSFHNQYNRSNSRKGKGKGKGSVMKQQPPPRGISFCGANGVIFDLERGRTMKNWFPRRLHGGRGVGRPRQAPNVKKNIFSDVIDSYSKECERKLLASSV